MTPEQVQALTYFDLTEQRTDGQRVNWTVADFETFRHLDDIRADAGGPIWIIRETHPHNASAVDFICNAPMETVIQTMNPRAAACGFYAGRTGPSYHLDTRPLAPFKRAARWMAVRPEDVSKIAAFKDLIYQQTAEWAYLRWNHPDSFRALWTIIQLAEFNRLRHQGGNTHV